MGAGLVGQAMHARHLWDERERFDFVAAGRRLARGAGGRRARATASPSATRTSRPSSASASTPSSCAVPDAFHADVTLAALEAGLHVLCEKPLAMTVRECDAIVAARDRTGLVVQVGVR